MIDKDIEILKEFTESDFCLYGQEEIIEATKNVLSEFEILKRQVNIDNNILEKQDKEIETYKKIAEKLAEKLVEIEDGCKHIPTEICNKYSNGRCKQCIIEWERNEVEKDESKR